MVTVKDTATGSPTESESPGSAGHVSHMFGCGFPGSIHTQTHTQLLTLHTCAHSPNGRVTNA